VFTSNDSVWILLAGRITFEVILGDAFCFSYVGLQFMMCPCLLGNLAARGCFVVLLAARVAI